MRLLVASVTCCLALALAGGAPAQQTIAPPGNSGVDQYFETVPGAGGNLAVHRTPPASGGSTGSAPGARGLARFGRDGQAAAALAAATAPARSGHAGAGARPGAGAGPGPGTRGGGTPGGGSAAPSASAAVPQASGSTSAVLGVLSGSDQGGLGLVLPILLLGALVAAVALGVLRRRRRRDPS
jgi:hypothetical protein